MWARGIGEYVSCKSCEKIFSKDEVYGEWAEIPLSNNLQLETVLHIEKILWWLPNCKCCGWPTKHVYEADEYIADIYRRYNMDQSYLSLAMDDSWEIIWFMDWYIATLEEIFENELKFHFSPNVLDVLYEKYKKHRNDRMLTVSSVWTDDKNKSLLTVFELLKNFFENFDDSQDDTSWVVESIIWSSTYCIFNIMWASRLDTHEQKGLILPGTQNPKFKTDILIQNWVIWKYKRDFNIRVREVATYSRRFRQKVGA
jgi:hypothetical protein